MLPITVPGTESYDEIKCEFLYDKDATIQLEHSLISISKWESKHHKSFLHNFEKLTPEETLDYIKAMTLTQNVSDDVYDRLTQSNINDIISYINDPMTATTFSESANGRTGGGRKEVITSELIYYWMIANQIPVEFEKWHINRLITLIRICNVKNTPSKKMSKRDITNNNAALNAARRKQYNTRG